MKTIFYNIPLSKKTELLLDENLIYIKNKKNKTFFILLNFLFLYKKNNNLCITLKNTKKKNNKLIKLNSNFLKLFYKLLSNKILGVSSGFFGQLECRGLGYKAKVVNGVLILNLGYSHKLFFNEKTNINIFCSKLTNIVFFSIEKQKLYEHMKYIYNFKKPDNYKGKGFIFNNEKIKLKEGKKI